MTDKVDVVVEHFSNRFSKGSINVSQEFGDTESLETIHKKILESAIEILKDKLLPSNLSVIIVHTDGSHFLLNDKYLAKHHPFKTDSSNTQEKVLKVCWDSVKYTEPTHSRSMYINYINQIRCHL